MRVYAAAQHLESVSISCFLLVFLIVCVFFLHATVGESGASSDHTWHVAKGEIK